MVLLQVLTASEKKGSVLSRFKRILCHSFLLATFVLRTRNKKKSKAQLPGIRKPSFSSHPPAPERCSARSEVLQLWFYF